MEFHRCVDRACVACADAHSNHDIEFPCDVCSGWHGLQWPAYDQTTRLYSSGEFTIPGTRRHHVVQTAIRHLLEIEKLIAEEKAKNEF